MQGVRGATPHEWAYSRAVPRGPTPPHPTNTIHLFQLSCSRKTVRPWDTIRLRGPNSRPPRRGVRRRSIFPHASTESVKNTEQSILGNFLGPIFFLGSLRFPVLTARRLGVVSATDTSIFPKAWISGAGANEATSELDNRSA